ncbi:MAG: hypothetical protein QM500_18225 [Methylococcales bacterium]
MHNCFNNSGGEMMIDLTKKYRYFEDEVLGIHHYPETSEAAPYLIVIKYESGIVKSRWIAENDPRLVEVKPKPVKVTQWFNVYRNGEDGFYLGLTDGYPSEALALRNRDKSNSRYITTAPMEIEIPAEGEE